MKKEADEEEKPEEDPSTVEDVTIEKKEESVNRKM